jgi:2-polyprenyl-3-methyl-5-hydroxy-6-metoxy-1,4-benzoquinol methylase
MDKRTHWDRIYSTKQSTEVSWTQEVPKTSLDFLHSFNLPKTASIIDVGGGDSNLLTFLIAEDYKSITILDISEKALLNAKASEKSIANCSRGNEKI